MANPYIGMNGIARKGRRQYIGINGIAREITAGYVGVNGIARKFYPGGVALSTFAEGSIVKLNENGNSVEFYVSKHDYESGLNGTGRTLLVRRYSYDSRQWHSSNVNAYASSDIDSWLNSTYKNLLDASIRTLIGTTEFYYTIGNVDFSKTTLQRSVFLLSAYELGMYPDYSNAEGAILPIASTLRDANYGSMQWTRSPRTKTSDCVWIITIDGSLFYRACSYDAVFCPCFTLPADTLVNPDTNIVLG